MTSTMTDNTGKPTETTPKKKSVFRIPRSWAELKALGPKYVIGYVIFSILRKAVMYILIPYLIYKGVIG